jgi:hypothetical protein
MFRHAVRLLRDADRLPAVLREGDHVAVQPNEGYRRGGAPGDPLPPPPRPISAPASRPMTPAERVDRVERAQRCVRGHTEGTLSVADIPLVRRRECTLSVADILLVYEACKYS